MKNIFVGAALFATATTGGWYFFGPSSDISGTYVGKNADQAYLIQIVQGANGQLTGFYEEAGLSADGAAVNRDNVPITGQRDGATFTVTLQPVGLGHIFFNAISLSGTYTGNAVTLAGQSDGFSLNLSLVKGNSADYTNYVASLNAQAMIIEKAREQREQAMAQLAEQQASDEQAAEARQRAAELAAEAAQNAAEQKNAVIQAIEIRASNDMNSLMAAQPTLEGRLRKLGQDIARVHDVTTMMQYYLAREASYGGSQTVPGSQLSVAINQANITLNIGMIGLQNHYNDVQQNGIPVLLDHFRQDDSICARLNATASTESSFTGPEEALADCLKIEEATPALQQQVSNLDAAYQTVFSTWQTEGPIQQEIIQQSKH